MGILAAAAGGVYAVANFHQPKETIPIEPWKYYPHIDRATSPEQLTHLVEQNKDKVIILAQNNDSKFHGVSRHALDRFGHVTQRGYDNLKIIMLDNNRTETWDAALDQVDTDVPIARPDAGKESISYLSPLPQGGHAVKNQQFSGEGIRYLGLYRLLETFWETDSN